MSKQFVLIPAEGDNRVITLEDGGDEVEFIQGLVGGYFETMTVPEAMRTDAVGGVFWVDENAGYKSVPVNFTSTYMTARVLKGTAVLTGPPNSEGETTSVPQKAIDVALEYNKVDVP